MLTPSRYYSFGLYKSVMCSGTHTTQGRSDIQACVFELADGTFEGHLEGFAGTTSPPWALKVGPLSPELLEGDDDKAIFLWFRHALRLRPTPLVIDLERASSQPWPLKLSDRLYRPELEAQVHASPFWDDIWQSCLQPGYSGALPRPDPWAKLTANHLAEVRGWMSDADAVRVWLQSFGAEDQQDGFLAMHQLFEEDLAVFEMQLPSEVKQHLDWAIAHCRKASVMAPVAFNRLDLLRLLEVNTRLSVGAAVPA